MAKKTLRPGRTLLIFFISVAVLYGLAALGGTWKPRLGLDLEGGTRITLQAISDVNQTKLEQARGIIDQRVNGSGVSEASVTTQGSRNIVVEIPGKNSKNLIDAVKRTAQMRFRIVAGQPLPGIPATSTPSANPTTTPSGTPTSSPSASVTSQPKANKKKDKTAAPNPRVAPHYADDEDPTPTPTPTDTPAATPGATPAASAASARSASSSRTATTTPPGLS